MESEHGLSDIPQHLELRMKPLGVSKEQEVEAWPSDSPELEPPPPTEGTSVEPASSERESSDLRFFVAKMQERLDDLNVEVGLLRERLRKDEILLGEPTVELDPGVGEKLPFTLHSLLLCVESNGASDLHLKVGAPPTVRLQGQLVPIGDDELTPDQVRRLVFYCLPHAKRVRLSQGLEVDHAYESEQSRYRVNAFLERGNFSAAFRRVTTEIPDFETLGLPPILEKLSLLHHGLILVTGPAGSGKSTTLASMVDFINRRRRSHIVTIEDPIEFYHYDQNSIITQREVGSDTPTYEDALKNALRQDPNVIMLGELRDAKAILTAVTAAETGHLVLSTLHTPNAVQAVDRIIDSFDGAAQKQVRLLLASTLRGVVSQRLVRNVEGKLMPATEVMVCTSTISSLILEGNTHQIAEFITKGGNEGMHTFTQSLANLVNKGKISKEEAYFFASNVTDLRFATEGRSTGGGYHH